ncbi:hypothetical protein NDU88_003850 [Pleurodeles waltl]|uniref:Uncharacterized protein n=1 Tax=Pleurodeles waltl TaxID=8319 RepID=A0AAV7UEU4_PLEWA|nr:hypothetical protein NDU88_003850 [Pleurodeles waltl]
MTADSLFFRVQRSSVRGIHRVFLCSQACLYLNQRLRRTVSTPSPLQDRSSHIAFGISSVAGQPSVLCLNRRPRCTVSTPSPKQDRSSHIAVEIAYHMHTLAAILEISTEIGSREDDNDVVVCSVYELLDGALDEQGWREACETDQDMKSGIRAVVTGCIDPNHHSSGYHAHCAKLRGSGVVAAGVGGRKLGLLTLDLKNKDT